MSDTNNTSKQKKIEAIEWLMEGDPAIQWQVSEGLLSDDEKDVHEYRLRVELEGWGHEVLELQRADGFWTDDMFDTRWVSNFWVLHLLKRLGIYPLDKLKRPAKEILEFIKFNGGITDDGSNNERTCLSGLALGILSYFKIKDKRRSAILEYLIENQFDDGSWSCSHDSENKLLTTIAVLEGLRDHLKVNKLNESMILDMKKDAHEFLLEHEIFKDSENGTIHDFNYFKFPFPYLRFDVMTVLDYFQSVNHPFDSRIKPAVEVLASKGIDYKWIITSNNYETIIDLEEPREESRWNTLRAIRILKWWRKVSKDDIDIILS